jgi:hypothetical protein
MKYLILMLALLALPVQARHDVHLKNLNLDKNNHFAVGAALGAFDWKLGCAAGALKELSDSRTHEADVQDFLYTCAGAGLSHWLGDGKSGIYKYNVVVILLDGLSTDNAIRQGGFEVGVPKKFIGHIPSTAQIALFSVARLLLLNSSEGWSRKYKDGFQWGTAIAGTLVVYANYSVNFK